MVRAFVHVFSISLLVTITRAEYSCVCSYSVEQQVYNAPDTSAKVIGYLYEFDCKKTTMVPGLNTQKFYAIEFQKQLGYVANVNDIQSQICPGDPSLADLIPTTTPTPPTTTTVPTSTMVTKPSTSPSTITTVRTTSPSTSTLASTTTPTQSTSTTSTSTTTSTLAPSTTTSTTSTTSTAAPTTTTLKPSTSTTSTLPSTTPTTTSTMAPTTTSTMAPTTTSTVKITTKTTSSTTRMTTLPPRKPFDTTGSPLAYLGIGYNLLMGNPGGMDKSKAGKDPGFLVAKRIFQLTQVNGSGNGTPREAELTTRSACSTGSTSTIVHDGKSYQRQLAQYIQNSRNQGSLTIEAFSLNPEFVQVRQHTEIQGSTLYKDVTSSCLLGQMRYKENIARGSDFSISWEFAGDACKLPKQYSKAQYMAFIDKWGTSIVTSSDFGTLTVTRYQTTAQQVLGHLQQEGKDDIIYPSGPYDGYPSSIAINSTELSKIHWPSFGSRLLTHNIGTKHSPLPINIGLVPLTEALNIIYWRKVLRQGICADSIDEAFLHQVASNMESALKQYASYRKMKIPHVNTKPLIDHPVMVPMTWPHGTYGLMMTNTGCPGSKVPWAAGYRTYDTEDTDSHSYFSSGVQNYMAGSFHANNIQTKFCMKTKTTIDFHYDKAWPQGSYCLLKRGTCPSGFQSGFVFWDDQDLSNGNDRGGSLPDGSYNHNTKILYCCRNDGPLSKPVLLPRDRPFVLIRYGKSCQSVFNMDQHEVFIRWDDEDLFNSDEDGGKHPYDDGGSKDHKLHFCHYRERTTGTVPGIVG